MKSTISELALIEESIMQVAELLHHFELAHKKAEFIGTPDGTGAVVGLELEGRIFLVFKNEVISRVNLDSVYGLSDRSGYKNPGGDGLWPAPEGTQFGYLYSTGDWEVPIGLVNSRFVVLEKTATRLYIEAEVPLINAQQRGIPTIFRRDIQISGNGKIAVTEEIEYTGRLPLTAAEFRLTPWSLCQFDWQKEDYFQFPAAPVRDLYTSSEAYRTAAEQFVVAHPTTDKRYQIALDDACPYIELFLKSKNLKVRRTISEPGSGDYIDIADAPITQLPQNHGIKYSFYNDPSGFLEIESAGCAPAELAPHTKLQTVMLTEIAELA